MNNALPRKTIPKLSRGRLAVPPAQNRSDRRDYCEQSDHHAQQLMQNRIREMRACVRSYVAGFCET